MAGNTTTLEAVNEILAASVIMPVSALDTGGASDAAEAERVLDRVDYELQTQGFLENTKENQSLTSAGSVLGEVTGVTAGALLRIEGYGQEKDRWAIEDNGTAACVIDRWAADDDVPSGTYTVRVVIKKDFADLGFSSKRLIITRAAQIFQRRKVGNDKKDAALSAELLEAEHDVKGPGFVAGDQPTPRRYFAGPVSQQQEQQRGG